ncbi:MAG: tetratricopeptide repeat protein [Elusimicrobia bacterium]|nr:tetratricopeptide repeat protein [Elusimicrobiota bacterium]
MPIEDGPKALLAAGTALYNQGRFAKAAEAFEEAIRRGAAGDLPYCFLAHAYASAGYGAKAARLLKERARRSRRPGPLLDALAKIASAKGADAPASMLLAAEKFLQRGEPLKAERALREVLRLRPGLARAHLMLGLALEARNEPATARHAYEEALRLDPASVDACLGLGGLLRRAGDPEGAQARLREAVRLDPRHARARIALGGALQASGRGGEALAEFEAALRLAPGSAQAHLRIGELLLDSGDYGRAEAHLSNAAKSGQAPGAVVLRSPDASARKESAQAPDAFFLLGRAREGRGRPAAARRAYEAALRLDGGHVKARLRLAELLSDAGSHAKAEAHLREAVRRDPGNAAATISLGATLQKRGRTAEAAREFEHALRVAPDSALAHLRLGELLLASREFARAAAHLQEAARLDGNDPRLRLLLGIAWESDGRLQEAGEAYLAAARLEPGAPEALLRLGGLDLRRGMLDEAEERVRSALRLDPRSVEGSLALGKTLEAAGKPALAERAYARALRLSPRCVDARLGLGRLCLGRARLAEAQGHLRRAVARDRACVEAHFLLGKTLENLRRFEPAAASYGRALALSPGSTEIRVRLGEARLLAGDLAGSLAVLRQALKSDDASAEAHWMLGRVLEAKGLFLEAEAAYGKAAGRAVDSPGAGSRLADFFERRGWRAQAESLMRQAARLEGRSPEGRVKLAEFLKSQARFAEAAEVLRAGLRDHPGTGAFHFHLGWLYEQAGERALMAEGFERFLASPDAETGSDARLRRFLASAGLDRHEAMIKEAEGILEEGDGRLFERLFRPWTDNWLRPQPTAFYAERLARLEGAKPSVADSPWGRFYRGILLARLSRTEESLSVLDPLAGLRGKRYGWMRHVAGVLRLREGRYEAAALDFQAALESRPRAMAARGFLAETLLCMGKTAAALGEFGKAERSEREGGSPADVWAWRGEALLWLGRYEDALEDLNRAVSAGTWLALAWRGGAHLLLGRLDAAAADLDRAIGPGSRDAEALVWRGELRRLLGRLRESLEDLDRAVELDGGPWAFVNRALTRAALKDDAGARLDFEAVPAGIVTAALRRLGGAGKDGAGEPDVLAVLGAALEMARGVRRHEAYLRPLWSKFAMIAHAAKEIR